MIDLSSERVGIRVSARPQINEVSDAQDANVNVVSPVQTYARELIGYE